MVPDQDLNAKGHIWGARINYSTVWGFSYTAGRLKFDRYYINMMTVWAEVLL